MKKYLCLILALCLALGMACVAHAEAPAGYPNQPVNLIVGFGAGGSSGPGSSLFLPPTASTLSAMISVT